MLDKYNNYWFSTYEPKINNSLALPTEVDIAIIGGGFGAMTLLFQLLRHKINDVILLEENILGFKNTGRSTGQITLTGGQKYFSQYKDKNFAKEYLKLTAQSIRQLNKSLEVLDCDFNQNGGIHLAQTDNELQFFKEEIDFLNENEIDAVFLDQSDIQTLLNTKTFAGGMYIPCESSVNPYKLFYEAKHQLNGFGNKIFQNAKVEYINENNRNFELLIHERGTIKAKRIVYCSGLNFLPNLKSKTQTIFHQILVSEKQKVPAMNVTCNYNSIKLISYDQRFILDSISKSKKIIDDNLLSRQKLFIETNFPHLSFNIEYICSYNEVISKDNIPLIGEISDGQYVMIGHELSHSCLSGAVMCSMLLGNPPMKNFDPMRD